MVLSLIIIVLGEQHRFRPNGTGTAANDERWPALVKTTAASGDHSQHSTTLPPTPRPITLQADHGLDGQHWWRDAAAFASQDAGRCVGPELLSSEQVCGCVCGASWVGG
jgi:hypothetical protein